MSAYTCTRVHMYSPPPVSRRSSYPSSPTPSSWGPLRPLPLFFTIFTRRSFIKSGRPRAFSILSMLRSTCRCVPLSLRSTRGSGQPREKRAFLVDFFSRNWLPKSFFFLLHFRRFDNRHSIILCRSYDVAICFVCKIVRQHLQSSA